jgi:hypothetical protein
MIRSWMISPGAKQTLNPGSEPKSAKALVTLCSKKYILSDTSGAAAPPRFGPHENGPYRGPLLIILMII